MKFLKLPFEQTLIIPGGQSQVTWDVGKISSIRDTGLKIIESAGAIENSISGLLRQTMFKEVVNDNEFITGMILDSEWCTFSAKRKLCMAVIERYKLLEGERKNELDSTLGKVIKYRNAFTHGKIIVKGDQVVLSYFESKPMTVAIDEEYWTKLETIFCNSYQILNEITSKPFHAT